MAKTLPQYPYLQNIVAAYRSEYGHNPVANDHYRTWLRQFGFTVPVPSFDQLEFPDDFSDEQLMLFILRWSL
jgi:hypothetical protein